VARASDCALRYAGLWLLHEASKIKLKVVNRAFSFDGFYSYFQPEYLGANSLKNRVASFEKLCQSNQRIRSHHWQL